MTVLVTAPVYPMLSEALQQRGYEVIYEPQLSYEELLERIAVADGLVVTTRLRIDAAVLQRAVRLRWIGRLGSGMELIDAKGAAERGIHLFSTPEGNRGAVAEHALGLLLAGMNRIPHSFREVAAGIWKRDANRGTELSGKTVGLLGYGNTGEAFARLLQPFGVRVLAFDKYRTGFGGGYVEESGPERIYAEAHVVSLHLPLTGETRGLAGDRFFSLLQRRPWFMTTCRGGVTVTDAVVRALKEERIAGALLDVLENEKPDTYSPAERERMEWLCAQPNVIVTPHIAGYSHEAYRRMAEVLLEKLDRLPL